MTTSGPMKGAYFKVVWGYQHLDLLDDAIATYLGTKPYAFPIKQQGEKIVVHKPVIVRDPDSEIGARIGDCLCAAMAALDYVVWELATKYAGRPLKPPHLDGTDTPSFPLFSVEAKYLRQNPHPWHRYGIPAHIIAVCGAVQPHNRGYEPLGLLYYLVNQDKHRLPIITKGRLDSGDLRIRYGGEVVTIAESSATSVAVQTPAKPPSSHNPEHMQVDANLTPYVALDDPLVPGEPVQVTLEKILLCVDSVLERFAPFLQ